jgi:tight adherence protein B
MTGAAVGAVLCAVVAGLLWPAVPAARLLGRRLGQRPRPSGGGRDNRAVALLVAGLAVVAGWLWGGPAATAVAVAVLLGWWWRHRRGRSAVVAETRRREVLAGCQSLAALLRSGQPPVAALAAVATDWPATFGTVAAAGRFDGRAGPALRAAARAPGAEGLAALAVGWEVSAQTGAGLADLVDGVVVTLRDRDTVRREMVAQLASARATARLLAGLPLLPHGLGVGLGADPTRFLFRTPYGLGCLMAGGFLVVAGLLWVDRLGAHPLATTGDPA